MFTKSYLLTSEEKEVLEAEQREDIYVLERDWVGDYSDTDTVCLGTW